MIRHHMTIKCNFHVCVEIVKYLNDHHYKNGSRVFKFNGHTLALYNIHTKIITNNYKSIIKIVFSVVNENSTIEKSGEDKGRYIKYIKDAIIKEFE